CVCVCVCVCVCSRCPQRQQPVEPRWQARAAQQRIAGWRAGAVGLELQRGELAGNAPAPPESAGPATPGAPAITTLVISNIPMDATQRDLLGMIDRTGFADRYDFAYMPRDFEAGTAKGYAFVNFDTPRTAREFFSTWDGSQLIRAGAAAPVLEVRASALQGYGENARRWTARRLLRTKNPEFRPFIAERPAAG
ncbi:unnamed protein product, partial [Prorocentrum cordatum]